MSSGICFVGVFAIRDLRACCAGIDFIMFLGILDSAAAARADLDVLKL